MTTLREGDKLFTFYWRTGDREVFPGRDAAEALNNAGYGAGALRALDFHAKGDNHEYEWNPTSREWDRKATAEPLPTPHP